MSYRPLPTTTPRPSSPSSSPTDGTPNYTEATSPYHDSTSNVSSDSLPEKDELSYPPWHRQPGERRRKRNLIALGLVLAVMGGFALLGIILESPGSLNNLLRTADSLLLIRPALLSQSTALNATVPVDWLQDPLLPSKELDFDDKLLVESLPDRISTFNSSSIVLRCTHSNVTMCASAYRVLLLGPSMHSSLFNDSTQLDERRVEVRFEVRDPGEYKVYAWPEHDQCDQWNHGGRPYFKLAVTGTPAILMVEGPAPKEGMGACTDKDDLTDGRWIAKNHINPIHRSPGSPYYSWLESHLAYRPPRNMSLTDYLDYSYFWAPYSCKPQHHSFDEWIEIVKPDSLLMMGDSVSRDWFCRDWASEDPVCKYRLWVWDYERTDKYVSHPRTTDNGTSHLYFRWEPLAESWKFESYIKDHPHPPTHVFFNIALWITRQNGDPDYYVSKMRPFLQTVTKLLPNAKIVVRTSAGAVQQIACWDIWNIRRKLLEPVNAAFLELLKDFPTLTVLDAYPIYNSYPGASYDGRHWERIDAKDTKQEEGVLSYALTDLVFEGWRQQQQVL
ncbi:hypothetical protein JCM1841_003254 [Sporobolomyces salmonicolor]